jgi:serine carboxypeptidase-like clade 2
MHACMQIGNAALDDETDMKGMIDYAWHHALISDRQYQELKIRCDLKQSGECFFAINEFYAAYNDIIDMYSLYTSRCVRTSISRSSTTNDTALRSKAVIMISIIFPSS